MGEEAEGEEGDGGEDEDVGEKGKDVAKFPRGPGKDGPSRK